MKITKGAQSLKEILPLLNRAFHTDFPALLPKLYSDDTYLDDHYLSRDENGQLLGVLAAIPSRFIIGNTELLARGIGMVGVKRSARRQGVMNAMLLRAVADARADNTDYLYLSGNRKRYERYGFVPCNYLVSFTVIKENIKHTVCNIDLHFEKYNKKRHIDDITRIYDKRYARYERYDMHKTLMSWKNKRILVAKLNDTVVGYCVIKNFTVNELALDGISASDFIVNLFNKYYKLPFLYVDTYDVEYVKSLARLAQNVKSLDDCSICVLNYWNVIETLLKAYPTGHNYEFVLEIENNGKKLIKENNGATAVIDTDRTPDRYLRADEATMALFSPPISYSYGLPFTLKLSVTHNDNV